MKKVIAIPRGEQSNQKLQNSILNSIFSCFDANLHITQFLYLKNLGDTYGGMSQRQQILRYLLRLKIFISLIRRKIVEKGRRFFQVFDLTSFLW